jgi:hypothetical protein
MMTLTDFLIPGDVLLYRPKGLFGWIIRIKTWHPVGHCEVYIGNGESVASRDGQGVGRYPLRTSELFMVCRPKGHFNRIAAMKWFLALPKTPYGWLDLLAFAGVKHDAKGIVCSPFCTEFQRAGGIDIFNGEPSRFIAPFQFALDPAYDNFDVKDGAVTGEAHV